MLIEFPSYKKKENKQLMPSFCNKWEKGRMKPQKSARNPQENTNSNNNNTLWIELIKEIHVCEANILMTWC